MPKATSLAVVSFDQNNYKCRCESVNPKMYLRDENLRRIDDINQSI